jgi:hypothetical protein
MIKTAVSSNFRFWVPLESIEKSKNAEGKVVMKVGGLASTKTRDMDGESLDPNGFDISYLKNKGIINWNHNKSPNAVIGEPISAKITKDGLHIIAELYPDNELAKSVFGLAQTLEKNSKTRRLGFSIEGKATERDENDKTKVTKAMVTNLALTISPKNPDSIVDIIKGEFNELEDSELVPYDIYDPETDLSLIKGIESTITKSMSAGETSGTDNVDTANSGASLKTESVEGTTKKKKKVEEVDDSGFLCKSEVMNRILNSDSVISFEKANQIYEKLNLISTMANEKSTITDELLTKALSTLGISKSVDTDDNLSKGADDDSDDNDEDDDNDEMEAGKTTKAAAKPKMKKGITATDDEEDDVDPINKAMSKIQKSLDYGTSESIEMFRGVGTLLKGIYDEVKEVRAENVELRKSLEEYSGQPAGVRKSVTRPLAKTFEKGINDEGDNLNKSTANTLSVSQHKNQVLTLLDVMAFEKGFDNEMAKAMTTFESSSVIDPIIQARIKNEKGITLVK